MSTTLIAPRKEQAPRGSLESSSKTRLAKVLAEYERANEELGAFRARVSRAQADIDMALDSKTIAEQEVMDRISAGQSAKAAFESPIANREIACKQILQQLGESVAEARMELSNLVSAELSKRREILCGRIKQAGQITERVSEADLDTILESSKPMIDVRSLEVPSQVLLLDSAEHKVRIAKQVLAGLEAITVKKGEQI